MRFLGGLLSQQISLFQWYVHISAWLQSIVWLWMDLVSVLGHFCTQFVLLFGFVVLGGKNQEQAHAVTIMSLQLVTFRREGSALKLKWLCFFYELYDCWPSWLLHEKNRYLSGRPSDGWPKAEKHHYQHQHQDQGASIPDICKFWYAATLFKPE